MTDEMLRERLTVYEALYEQNPRDGIVGVARTYLYVLAGRSQDALKSALESSLSVTAKSVRVQMAIALGYYLRDKPSEALTESRYALNIDPAGPLCHLIHASILLTMHRCDEARVAFLKSLSLSSDNTFLTDLRLRNRSAICSAQEENPLLAAYGNLRLPTPEMSEADTQQLIDENPTDPVLKVLRASVQRHNGRIREALATLETDLAAYESFPERLFLLWKVYEDQLGDRSKGDVFVRRLLAVDPLNDRATGPAYAHLDAESLHHINFVKSLEELPDSIYARILPIADLENLTAPAPSGHAGQDTSSVPPETPVTHHVVDLLEEAGLIARDLRTPTAPVPSPSSQCNAPAAPTPGEPEDMDVDALLQTAENETAEAAFSSATPSERAHAGESSPLSCPSAGQEVPASTAVTLCEANRLLQDSRFEEAMRAFIALGGKT